jgi:hypothetical protein
MHSGGGGGQGRGARASWRYPNHRAAAGCVPCIENPPRRAAMMVCILSYTNYTFSYKKYVTRLSLVQQLRRRWQPAGRRVVRRERRQELPGQRGRAVALRQR